MTIGLPYNDLACLSAVSQIAATMVAEGEPALLEPSRERVVERGAARVAGFLKVRRRIRTEIAHERAAQREQ